MTDLARARDLVDQLAKALADTSGSLPPGKNPSLDTPDALDRALATASAGAVLTLSTSFVYPAPLTLRQSVILMSELVGDMRMTRDTPAPKFLGGLTIAGDGVLLVGVEVRHGDPTKDLVVITGQHVGLDRCRILGDPVTGGKRGIAANGTEMTIQRCLVDDCFGPYPGDDTQAICSWDMGGGLLINDCYLAGGSETVMIGGADPSSEDRTPRDITITRNTISKNPTWMAKPINVKNALEIKNAKRFRIEDNDIEYSWGGHGQTGYLLMLTVRNQDGRAPYSTIQDGTIRANRFRHGAAAINVLATDNRREDKRDRPTPLGQVRPSDRLARVTIVRNTFTDLDPLTYQTAPEKASHQLILLQRGPKALSITNNTFEGQHLTANVYFDGMPPADGLIVTGNTWPKTTYGVHGTGATIGKAWDQYVINGQLADNTETTP